MLNVQWKTPDDGQRNCPKHVDFLDKNKFGKLVCLLVLLKRNLFINIIIIFIFHLSIFGYIPRDVEIVKWSHIGET